MGCGGSKEEEQFSNVNAPAASGASKTPAAITKADTDAAIAGAVKDPESKRKFSERKRRRVAVASENSEMLASVRWQSAFDAIRKEEFKLPQHVNKIRDVITNHGIFGGLDAEIIEQMVNAMRVNKKKAGEIIINQGDAGDAFYIIGEGAVSVYLCPAADVDANEPVSTVEGGQAFGELALLYDAPRAATIKAVSDCLLFKLGRMHFRNLVSTAMEKSKVGLETRLAKVPVLQALESDQINHLAEAMEQVSFTDGQYIEKMGDIADSLYVLLSGEVACHRDDGQELRLSEGAIFGESSLSESGQKRQANIVAVGNVRCAKLLASDARDILGPLQAAIDHAFTRKVLSSVELFSSFDTKQMTEVISHMTLKKLKKGEAAVKQGEANKAFYVIRSGTCDIVVDENSVKTLGSGEFFGERSILKGEPANASVVASEDEVVLMCLSGEWVSNGSLTALISEVNKSREAELAAKKKTKLVIKHDDLKKGAVLGEGSFGVVCIASYDGKAYALKALHKGHLISTNQVKNTINEKNIMQQVRGEPRSHIRTATATEPHTHAHKA